MTSDQQQPPKETPEQTIARLEREAAARATPERVPPLIPRPAVTFIALLVASAMVGHLFYDAFDKDYEGWRVTMTLGVLVFFVLGGDVSKWLRGGR